MGFLTLTLSLCIGAMVACLLAIYTERGAYRLIWNYFIGTAGAALCALTFAWTAPHLVLVGLVTAGPFCALLLIVAVHAAIRVVWRSR